MAQMAYLTQVMVDHPVGLWALTDAVGSGVAADINPTEFNPITPGTPTNVTFGVPGPIGGLTAAKFNGSTSSIVTPSTPAGGVFDFPGVQPYSMEVLINIAGAAATGHWPRLIERELYSPVRNGYSMLIAQTSTNIYSEHWGAGVSVTSPAFTLTIGTWYHAVVTYDSAKLHLYVNGTEISTGTATVAAITTQSTFVGVSSSIDATFNGSMFGAAIYNYALSAAQIAAHYQAWQNPAAEIYVPFPSGFQPWDVAATFGGLAAWFTENYQGGGLGTVPSVGSDVIVALAPGQPATKYWAYPSSINPAG